MMLYAVAALRYGSGATSEGASWFPGVPVPSCALPFDPQQYRSPVLAVTPHVWKYPALKLAKASPPATGVGTNWLTVEPVPICP